MKKRKRLKKITRLSLQNILIVLGVFVFAVFVYGANQGIWGYKSKCAVGGRGGDQLYDINSLTTYYSEVEEHGTCKKIQYNTCSNDVFIPTKTSLEWTTFIANKPSCITLRDCPCAGGTIDGYNFDPFQSSTTTTATKYGCTATATCTAGTVTLSNKRCKVKYDLATVYDRPSEDQRFVAHDGTRQGGDRRAACDQHEDTYNHVDGSASVSVRYHIRRSDSLNEWAWYKMCCGRTCGLVSCDYFWIKCGSVQNADIDVWGQVGSAYKNY